MVIGSCFEVVTEDVKFYLLCEVMDVLINWIVILNYHVTYFKYFTTLHVGYILIN